MAVETNPGAKSKLPQKSDGEMKVSSSAVETKDTKELAEFESDSELPDTAEGSFSATKSPRPALKQAGHDEHKESPESEVQVPSTDSTSAQVQKKAPKQSQAQVQVQQHPEETEDLEEPNDDWELPAFDWDGLSERYEKELNEINRKEDEILLDFEKYVAGFTMWIEAKSEHDYTRSLKRQVALLSIAWILLTRHSLKTRERYVKISEHSLDQKKAHYQQVVQAFQKALDLLRAP